MIGDLLQSDDLCLLLSEGHDVATERMSYVLFRKAFSSFKLSDIPRKLQPLNEVELPTNSMLHMVDGMLGDPTDFPFAPNITNPLITRESFPVYMQFQSKIPDKEDPLFPVKDPYKFVPAMVNTKAMKFFQEQRTIRRPSSLKELAERQNVLVAVNYNPILGVRVTGQLPLMRKFNILLSTMLKTVSEHDHKYHHLYFPVSDHIYSRMQMSRPFDEMDRRTIRIYDDMSYYLMIHLCSYLQNTPVSLFSKLSKVSLESTFIILDFRGKAIIYNLGDLRDMFEKVQNSYVKVLAHVNNLKITVLQEEKKLDNDPSQDATTDTPSEIEPDLTDSKIEEIAEAKARSDQSQDEDMSTDDVLVNYDAVKQVDTEPSLVIKKDKLNHVELVHKNLEESLNKSPVLLNDTQKEKAKRLAHYEGVFLGGKPIINLIEDTSEPKIGKTIKALENVVSDKSLLKSSIMDFNKVYIKEMMDRDIAKVLTSFTQHGFILTSLDQKDSMNSFNQVRHISFTFTDPNGRNHKSSFKLPIVNDDGTFIVNGIRSRMVNQQVNLPICKINSFRVNLSSNFNKTLVERSSYAVNRFDVFIAKYIGDLQKANIAKVEFGNTSYSEPYAYEFASIAVKFKSIQIGDYFFEFNLKERTLDAKDRSIVNTPRNDPMDLKPANEKGVLFGKSSNGTVYYYMPTNQVHEYTNAGEFVGEEGFVNLLARIAGDKARPPKMPVEWTELKIQDKNFPIAFILGYKFGISAIIDKLKIKTTFVPKGKRIPQDHSLIQIPFSDGTLVFNRYPLEKSLVLAGFSSFNTQNYSFHEFDVQDTYHILIKEKVKTINYLKGIDAHFALFVDPMTRDVLMRMGEPTTFPELLIRATQMLSTLNAEQAASMKNHRVRGYERFASVLYNQISRGFSSYMHNRTQKKAFSINPEAVFQSIIQDPTTQAAEDINPVHDLKMKSLTTYAGSGGRTARSFVIEDRRFPDDAVGVLSEATPDSGKVAINAYMSGDPVIQDIRGIFTKVDPSTLSPANILSVSSLLMPGVTHDDGKRANYTSIQLSHHVPCDNSEVGYVRTGYEMVVAHHTNETFSYPASKDGIVESIDEDLGVMRIRYKSEPLVPKHKVAYKEQKDVDQSVKNKTPLYVVKNKDGQSFKSGDVVNVNGVLFRVGESLAFKSQSQLPSDLRVNQFVDKVSTDEKVYYIRLDPVIHTGDDVDVVRFGDQYASISGSYIKQSIILNVKEGEKFKEGDILAYNKGFFAPAYNSKQVHWKIGVLGSVALMDVDRTLEDSSVITQEFGKRLGMTPGHTRVITMLNDTSVANLVNVGDEVQTTDPLCVVEEGAIDLISGEIDDQTLEFLADLNKNTPKAKYHGKIVDISFFYCCEPDELHPSLHAIGKKIAQRASRLLKAMQGTKKEHAFVGVQKVDPGMSYKGLEFEKGTVALFITIADPINCGIGDKLVMANANKSIVGDVIDRPISTESGYKIDLQFAASGIQNRIVTSAIRQGTTNRVMEKLTQDVIQMYFG